MPASNSEARKRHEAAAATTDALAEALSNVASGVVLEALPTSARPPRDYSAARFDRTMTRVECPHCMVEGCCVECVCECHDKADR